MYVNSGKENRNVENKERSGSRLSRRRTRGTWCVRDEHHVIILHVFSFSIYNLPFLEMDLRYLLQV